MKKPRLEEMTLRDKIAQTLLVRQSYLMLRADLDYKVARGPEEAAQLVAQNQFGGLWPHGHQDVNGIKDSLNKSFHC